MKRFALSALSLACCAAMADTNTLEAGQVVTTQPTSLYTGAGTGNSIATVTTSCAAQASPYKTVTKPTPYICKIPVIVSPKAKQPADRTRLSACGSGYDGRFLQVQTPVFDLATNSWVFNDNAWLPSSAPTSGVCTPIKPPQPADVVTTSSCTSPQVGTLTITVTTIYNAATNKWDSQPPVTTGTCTTPDVTPPVVVSNMPVVDMTKLMAAAPGNSAPRVQTAPLPFGTGGTQAPNPSDVGAFRIICGISHMAKNDPLIYPGQAGASHLHTFAGNTGTNENSTATSIANSGNSTCSGGTLNRSGYWFPTMIDTTDGTPIAPLNMLVYYKTGYGGVKPADVKAMPTGLRFIAGDSKATAPIPWGGAGRYSCIGGTTDHSWSNAIPASCGDNNEMIMEVSFPQCWDGVNLDSPDHKGHMAEATGSGCPKTHPVAIPEISFEIHYAVNNARMPKWRLSSDNYASSSPGGYSAHGDYMLGWDAATLNKFIKNCDNTSFDCHTNLLGDGTWLY